MPVSLLHQIKPFALPLLLPPVPFILLTLLGALLLRRAGKRYVWGQLLIGVGLAGIWLGASVGVGQLLSRDLLQAPSALSAQALADLTLRQRERGDVAVLVLGGGARQYVPEYGGSALNEYSLARLRYGVWLAKQLKVPLGFSGGIGWTARKQKDSEASIAERTAADEFAFPLRWAEGSSRDTQENAALSVQLLKADGIRQIVLVTHELHMPRALRAFTAAEQDGMEIVAAPVGLRQDGMSEWLDWVPTDDGLARVRYAVYEWLGLRLGY
jgi:uncharacterized SAM-binding protein YcdF (DUF218 family)